MVPKRSCPCFRGLAAAAALVLALGLLLPSCRETEQEDKELVLRVSNWGGVNVDTKFMTLEREIREGFEKQHAGVRVQFEQIPGVGQYAPKLLMMHVTGSVPDVATLDASSAAVFIDNGVLRDLTPYIQRDRKFDLSRYFENVVNIARRGDKLYAVPLDFTPMMMYYNKRLFDAAGVPYPKPGWTWEEFLVTARSLTVFPAQAARSAGGQAGQPKTGSEAPQAQDAAAGAPRGTKTLKAEEEVRPTQFGMNFENFTPFWSMWLWLDGGDVLDPTGKRATGYLDGPKSVEAMQFLVDLMLKYRVAPTPKETAAAGQNMFRSQRAAMDLKGHWMMIDFRSDGIDFGAVSLPTNTGRRVTVIYESGLAITTKAKHPDLAWEYIKYMTAKDVQIRRVASGLAISANKDAATYYANNEVEDAFIAEVPYARPPWGATVERYPFIEDLLRDMMEDILYSEGKVTVEKALHETAKLIDAALVD